MGGIFSEIFKKDPLLPKTSCRGVIITCHFTCTEYNICCKITEGQVILWGQVILCRAFVNKATAKK